MFKNILCIVLFLCGTYIIWSKEGPLFYLAIFMLMWSNNIGIMKNIEQLRKRDRGILRNIFGNNFNKKQIEEIMSQNMKISER
jgi:hypothetical protein